VLIPRPETELLVEKAFAEIERMLVIDPLRTIRALDAGTGSGCIAVTIAAWWRERLAIKFPNARLVLHAWDISPEALEVARRNSRLNSVEAMVNFSCTDMLSEASYHSSEWDLLISNPPYIADSELADLEPSVREHEPHLALRADGEGLVYYNALARSARRFLVPGGKIFLEIGSTQAVPVQNMLASYGWKDVRVELDYARLPRNVFATNPG
jgi:release factor glutamine methyltransferase